MAVRSSSVGDSCSSSTSNCESSSSNISSSTSVSLLEKLRSPTPAEISQKQIVKTNAPPVGKKRLCTRGTSVNDPKGIDPKTRVQEFPDEKL